MTVARSTCASCGAVREVGALAVYAQAPGTVVRCPGCDAVLLRVARGEGRIWLDLQGVSCLELRAPTTNVTFVNIPEIRFAMSGDVHIAYQVIGDGPVDLVKIPDRISNLELQWENPLYAEFLERLASFSRVLLFDKRARACRTERSIRTSSPWRCGSTTSAR